MSKKTLKTKFVLIKTIRPDHNYDPEMPGYLGQDAGEELSHELYNSEVERDNEVNQIDQIPRC